MSSPESATPGGQERGLAAFFRLRERGTTVGREVMGGLTTFLTMAYIIAVQPTFMVAAGMPREGAILATCVATAAATILMGLLANYPIALAPGMGLNAFFTYSICLGAGVPWPTALGLVFWSGVLFLLLSVTGVRALITRAVPKTLRLSAAAGIGLFLAFIGLQQGGLVGDHPVTLVTLSEVTAAPALLTLAGLAVILVLAARGVGLALFGGIVATLILALATGWLPFPDRLFAWPQGPLPGLSIDLWGALRLEYLPLIFVLLFFDLFDTLGTLLAVGQEAELVDEEGQLPRLEKALTADSVGTVAGALVGTSPVTSYVESGAGVSVGARTGLSSLVVGGLFLLATVAAPLAVLVSAGGEEGLNPVTAPALLWVGVLMARALRQVPWDDLTEAAPAFFTALLMPLTYNIAHGLSAGILIYALGKAAAGRGREVHWLLYVLSALLVLRYAFLPL
ncbi:MAG: NCS2 family permease [Acidobacteriota bacterium]